jgi:hypothetical protein
MKLLVCLERVAQPLEDWSGALISREPFELSTSTQDANGLKLYSLIDISCFAGHNFSPSERRKSLYWSRA